MPIDYNGITLPAAKLIQEQLHGQLRLGHFDESKISTIAGADISFNKNSTELYAAIVILSYPDMRLRSYALAKGETDFPYVPGYLAFREVPTLLTAWEMLPAKPDVIMLDGQGILHPRRMGIAPHFGVLTGSATLGCAKTSLYGQYEEPRPEKYAVSSIFGQPGVEHIGYALRTKQSAKIVYVSPGNGMDLGTSLAIAKKCIGKYRIPEPTRMAHGIVNAFRMGKLTEGYHEADIQQQLF